MKLIIFGIEKVGYRFHHKSFCVLIDHLNINFLPTGLFAEPCTLHGEEEHGAEDLRKEIVIVTDFECLEDVQDLVTALLKDARK